jgi:hypothetical protein
MKPGSERIEKEWAASFIAGLVPPEPIQAESKCSCGVSKVETQHSFLNSLVSILTVGIYTPMEIRVTCAESGSSTGELGPGATEGELQARAP